MRYTTDFLFNEFIRLNGSDLYCTVGAAPTLRVADRMHGLGTEILTEDDINGLLEVLLDDDKRNEFESTMEFNTAFNWNEDARFRMNVLRQRQYNAIVIRRIHTRIPSIPELGLSKVYSDLIMEKRGLVLVVGATGSGKSTSLAAMLEHRNLHGSGHILTVEDPVEYVLSHKGCIITQRDLGIDTFSFNIALKNALRQRPDVVVIGEIRDRETMEHALTFAETGHLCLATLHANNANQAIERIINFFNEERHKQILLNLSLNLKGVLSQRFVKNTKDSRSIVLEVLLNQGLIRSLIQEGRVKEIKEMIEKGRDAGMQSFDQSLFDLYKEGIVEEDMAIIEAENPSNLRLQIKQHEISRKGGLMGNTGQLSAAMLKPSSGF